MKTKIFLLLAFISLLSSCVTPEKKPLEVEQEQQDFIAYTERMHEVNTWSLKGRLAIRAEKGSGTLNLLWDQEKEQTYVIRFIAPFGQGAFDIRGFPETVVLKDASGLVLVSPTAEELLENTMGLKFRLKGLAYWVRGIPEPEQPFTELKLDEEGRLESLTQSNVSVKLSRYSEQGGYQLPGKIKIKGDSFRLSLAIHNWDLKLGTTPTIKNISNTNQGFNL